VLVEKQDGQVERQETPSEHIERRLMNPMQALNKFPKYFLIETTNTCNARCIMCGIDFDKKAKQIIQDDLYERIADEIGQYSDHVEKVMPYLDGEPMIDKKLPERVAKMKAVGVKNVNIASNASLLTDKMGRRLVEAGLDEIYITLDSMKKDVYEAIRVRLDFDIVFENILRFIKLRDTLNPNLRIRMQMVLQELNYTEGVAFESFWRDKLGPNDQVVLQKAHNWANAVDVMSFGDEQDVNALPCIALWGTFVIHVNGDAALCCMDTETKHFLGNIWEESIEQIWNGPKIAEIRAKHLENRRHEIEICNGCTLWREEKHQSDGAAE
jgi:radical SAM protein with 4Fe4S-binding SPASM domain